MNQKAASIGAEHSRFMNPHGLPAKGHYTTAYDLSLIASYALENETFRKIVSTSYYAPKGWKNKNKMLERYDGATGIKTGFTLNAGRCLVTSAQREDMSLVCVVLNSPEMYERSAQLLDKAYAEYSLVKLCSGGDTVDGLRIDHGFSYPLKASEMGEVHIETIKKNPLPAHKGEIAGLMQIHLGNRLIFSQNMYMI